MTEGRAGQISTNRRRISSAGDRIQRLKLTFFKNEISENQGITMKSALTAAEKRAKAALIEQLKAAGRDVETVSTLIDELVRAETRIAALTRKESALKGRRQDAVMRALTAVQGEKRKLHKRIWAGVTPEDEATEPVFVSADEIAKARRRLEGDEAWRRFLYRGDRSLTEAELTARYGEATWSAMLDETIESEVEGALEIARSHERSRTGFVQWPHVRLWL